MSEINLVLTDVDGTLVQMGEHAVSEANRTAIIDCENAGIPVIPVTGRPLGMMQQVLEVLGFDGLGIFDNGATIQNVKSGEIVWKQWMNVDAIRQVATILYEHASIIDYSPEYDEHTPADNEAERIANLATDAPYIFALIEENAIGSVLQGMDKIRGITYYTNALTRNARGYVGIQVNDRSATKFHGVEALRKIVGVPKAHTAAIGDGDNDLPLFENAAYRFAMGNASELLKAAATEVGDTVDNDGFAKFIRQHVLV